MPGYEPVADCGALSRDEPDANMGQDFSAYEASDKEGFSFLLFPLDFAAGAGETLPDQSGLK